MKHKTQHNEAVRARATAVRKAKETRERNHWACRDVMTA